MFLINKKYMFLSAKSNNQNCMQIFQFFSNNFLDFPSQKQVVIDGPSCPILAILTRIVCKF